MKTNRIFSNILSRLPFMAAGILAFSINANAQSFCENWDSLTFHLPNGWDTINHSTYMNGDSCWTYGGHDVNPLPAYNGAGSSCIGTGWGASGWPPGGIENVWLIAPVRTFRNGDVIHFFTFSGDTPSVSPDRLQLRLSLNGASSNVGTADTAVGDFTDILIDIDSTYSTAPYPIGYPHHYINFATTISGLGTPTSGRFAFRYYITNVRNGYGEYIAIDSVVYESVLGVGLNELEDESGNVTVFPNPSKKFFYFKLNEPIKEIEIKNILGEEILSSTINEADLSKFPEGVYLYQLITQKGKVYFGKLLKE